MLSARRLLRQMVAAGVEAHGQSYRFVRAGLAYQESAAERAARGGSAARRASRSPPTAGALRGAAPRALAPGQRRGHMDGGIGIDETSMETSQQVVAFRGWQMAG